MTKLLILLFLGYWYYLTTITEISTTDRLDFINGNIPEFSYEESTIIGNSLRD